MRFTPVKAKAIRVGACGVYRKQDIVRELPGLVYRSRHNDVVAAYREDDKYVYVARFLCRNWERDARALGVPIHIKAKLGARDDRQERILAAARSFDAKYGGFVIEAATGIGKTILSLIIAGDYQRKILVVVNKDSLANQWREEVKKTFGIPEHQIGRIQQDTCNISGCKVVIATAQSLAKLDQGRYQESVKTEFGVMIFDEAHHCPAETFERVMFNIAARIRIAVTAENYRGDDKHDLVHAHFGPLIIREDADNMPAKVAVVHTGLDFSKVYCPSPTMIGKVNNALAKSSFRNRLAVRVTMSAYKHGRRIIVFSALKGNHLPKLRELLIEAGARAEDIAYLIGGMSEAQVNTAKTKRILLATYQMAMEAFDMPALDTAVLLTPLSRPKQAVGRILRFFEGKKNPALIDFHDTHGKIITGFYSSRMKYYRGKEWDVQHLCWNPELKRVVQL